MSDSLRLVPPQDKHVALLSQIEDWNKYDYHDFSNDGYQHIYAILDCNDNIIYAGQAACIESRSRAHFKRFNEAKDCIDCVVPSSIANEVEAELILRALPKHNCVIPKNFRWMTLEQWVKVDPRAYTYRVSFLNSLAEATTLSLHYKVEDLIKASAALGEVK